MKDIFEFHEEKYWQRIAEKEKFLRDLGITDETAHEYTIEVDPDDNIVAVLRVTYIPVWRKESTKE